MKYCVERENRVSRVSTDHFAYHPPFSTSTSYVKSAHECGKETHTGIAKMRNRLVTVPIRVTNTSHILSTRLGPHLTFKSVKLIQNDSNGDGHFLAPGGLDPPRSAVSQHMAGPRQQRLLHDERAQ